MLGQLLALYFSLVSCFILISICCSGALLSSLVFEMEIKYVMMMMMNDDDVFDFIVVACF